MIKSFCLLVSILALTACDNNVGTRCDLVAAQVTGAYEHDELVMHAKVNGSVQEQKAVDF